MATILDTFRVIDGRIVQITFRNGMMYTFEYEENR